MKSKVNYSVKRVCRICKTEFISHSSNGRYCSEECKKKGDKENNRRGWDKQKEKMKIMYKPKGSALSQVAMAARKSGMTYGQYVGIYNI